MDIDKELINGFLAETKEYLESIEEVLLKMEKESEEPDPELVSEIFRYIHSIKGSAGFLGFVKVNDLSHVMETMLQMMRDGDIKCEFKYVDALLSGVDILNGMVDNIEESNNVDIEDILGRLSNLIDDKSDAGQEEQGSQVAQKEQQEQVEEKEQESQINKEQVGEKDAQEIGFEITPETLKAIPGTHEYLYIFEYNLSELQKQDDSPLIALAKKLVGTGSIIDIKFFVQSNNEVILCHLLYSSMLEADIVSIAADLDQDKIKDLPKEAGWVSLEIKKSGKSKVEAPEKLVKQPEIIKEAEPVKEFEPEENAVVEKETAVVEEKISKVEEKAETESKDISKDRVETIRINVEVLDKLMTLAGELVLVRNQLILSVDKQDAIAIDISERLDIVTSELQEAIMLTRMQQIGNVFGKLPRIVRDLSKKLDKPIEIKVLGSEVELDKTILESLAAPLTHIIRNCCDHGIETQEERAKTGKPLKGKIIVNAFHEAGHINIVVEDDGKGIDVEKIKEKALSKGIKTSEQLAKMTDKEILSIIMLSGFSTAEKISVVSGRGVGMDVVKTSIEQLGGTLEIDSHVNIGTKASFRLPLTLAIIPCLIVELSQYRYAIPQINLEELVCLYDEDVYTKIESVGDQEVYRLRDNLLPMVRLNEIIECPEPFSDVIRAKITEKYRNISKTMSLEKKDELSSMVFAVVKVGKNRFGLIVDNVIGTEEIVVKPMHSAVKSIDIYSGATVMGDGQVALILDIDGISRHAGIHLSTLKDEDEKELIAVKQDNQSALLFKSGEIEKFAVSLPLIRRIESISTSSIEKVGDREFITIDDLSTLIVRLDKILNVSACLEKEEMFLLLPKHIKRPFGILVSNILDISDASLKLDEDSYMEDGLLGTSIINNDMTLFLDIFRIIELAEPEWFAERRKDLPSPTGEKKCILLVEDAGFFRQLEKGYFESDNYEVITAENGREALDKLEKLWGKKKIDLIVSDIEMPIMDGWEFIKEIRLSEKFRDIPAMAVTALGSELEKKKTMQSGFDEWQLKLDREALLEKVAAMLEKI